MPDEENRPLPRLPELPEMPALPEMQRVPKPFKPGPPDHPGWVRGLTFGCAGLVVLLIAGGAYLATRVDDILQGVIGAMQSSVEERLPEGFGSEDRARLDAAFAAARARAGAGRGIDAEALQRAHLRSTALAAKPPGEVTREDVLGLVEALERFATGGPPRPGEEAREAEEPG